MGAALAGLAMMAWAGTAAAEETAANPGREARPGFGAVTNLPLPRFVSLKGTEGNARRGPALSQRIDWVFTRRGMPLEITAEFENWRLVQDKDGAGGWVHYSLLSGSRSVVITTNLAPLYAAPDERADILATLQADVVGRVSECTENWCRISAGGEKGWVQKASFWGVGPGELLD